MAATHILITGANGFVGQRLSERLLHSGLPIQSLALLDIRFDSVPDDKRVLAITGSIADSAVVRSALASQPGVVVHMACIPGGAAEDNFDLGRQVNLDATLHLLEAMRDLPAPPVFVYTSSVGVFGDPPAVVTDETPPSPRWSYGTHKAIGELLVSDYTRKGWIDGRSVRLPGIVPRPAIRNGAITIFQSDLIRELAAGRPVVCPVSPAATPWWMSVECCVDNLMIAATMEASRLKADRTYTLPVLRAAVSEIVDELVARFGDGILANLQYQPVAAMEAQFGRLPEVSVPAAEALGFRHDGTVRELVRRALSNKE